MLLFVSNRSVIGNTWGSVIWNNKNIKSGYKCKARDDSDNGIVQTIYRILKVICSPIRFETCCESRQGCQKFLAKILFLQQKQKKIFVCIINNRSKWWWRPNRNWFSNIYDFASVNRDAVLFRFKNSCHQFLIDE